MTPRIHNTIMHDVAAALRACPELAGVAVVEQNSEDLAAMLAKEEAQLDGPVAVVTVDDVRKLHSNPAVYAVSFSVAVTEYVPLRLEGETRTAIDVAMAAGEAVDAAKLGHFDNLTHTTPGGGVLEAVAKCSGEFTLTNN